MKVIDVDINILKPAEYNPRALSDEEARDLQNSITEFDMVEPIVVNSNKDRLNVIIGGHQRYNILKLLGRLTVPVVYIDLTLEREKELNLRLNRNLGHWDYKLLAEFEKEMLEAVGFAQDEMAKITAMGIDTLVDLQEVDISRMDVITVDGPNSPRLKNRKGFYFNSIEDFNEATRYFATNKDHALDGTKLLEIIRG